MQADLTNEICDILSRDARTTPAEIARMLRVEEAVVSAQIRRLEENRTIAAYRAVINRDKLDHEHVEALIEVKVNPQREKGFDAVAERIHRFSQVRSVFLMSGGFDLMVLVEGRSMRDVAFFVAEKLSTIDNVLSTATHFVLKKYKTDGVMLGDTVEDFRLQVSP